MLSKLFKLRYLVLALLLLLTGSPTLAAAAETNLEAVDPAKPVVLAMAQPLMPGGDRLYSAEQQDFWRGLVATWRPEMLADWESAFAEREQAQHQPLTPVGLIGQPVNISLQSPRLAPVGSVNWIQLTATEAGIEQTGAGVAAAELLTSFDSATLTAAPIACFRRVLATPADYTLTAEEKVTTVAGDGPADSFTTASSLDCAVLEATPVEFGAVAVGPASERAERVAELLQAVEAADGDAIATLLPALLDDYREITAEMQSCPSFTLSSAASFAAVHPEK